MAKIHTHYDNLKVSRKAPPEVIRAAYKALSQKYHPDKNPHDEKAARIMAVVNSAYNALSNAQTRKEHDEWIAAEEWEIEWLESTRAEEGKDKPLDGQAHGSWRAAGAAFRRLRTFKQALTLTACVLLGWGGAYAVYNQAGWLPWACGVLGIGNSDAAAGDPPIPVAAPVVKPVAPPPVVQAAPVTRVVVLSQIRLPELACDAEAAKLPASGNWPAQSAYLPNTRIGNGGGETQIVIDNVNNSSAVSVQLFDLEKNDNVRQAYILAHEKFTLQKLVAGNYEVHFDPVETGPTDKTECEARKHHSGAPAKP